MKISYNSKQLSTKLLAGTLLIAITSIVHATPVATYDIGASNWAGNTYTKTISGLTVTGAITGGSVVSIATNPSAVYAGNNTAANPKKFTYNLPSKPTNAESCTASLEFFHITNNSSGKPESVGAFIPAPTTINTGAGHTYSGNSIIGSGVHSTTTSNITTKLTWNLPSSISFNVPAPNGNISLIGHKKLVIDCKMRRPIKGDHFQCYHLEKANRLKPETILIQDQFGKTKVVLGRAKMLCNPSAKTHNGNHFKIRNKRRHLVCYDILKQSNNRPVQVQISNQFESQNVTATKREMFCVPSSKKHLK